MDKQLTRQEVFTKAYIALIDGKIGSEEFFNLAWNAALEEAARIAAGYVGCEVIAARIRALSSPAEAPAAMQPTQTQGEGE